jgi:Protein of unknown function (DUF3616)
MKKKKKKDKAKEEGEQVEVQLAAITSSDAMVEPDPSSEEKEWKQGEKKKKKKDKAKKGDKLVEVQPAPIASSDAMVEPNASPEARESKEQKKKKTKEKGQKEDERIRAARVRAWGGIAATVVSVVLTVVVSFLITRKGSDSPGVAIVVNSPQSARKLGNLSDIRKISGGRYEASGAVAVPDGNGILFVDDSKPGHVFYMPVNEMGMQDGPIKPIALGVSVEDPEGISQFGTRFVIVGSLSTLDSDDKGGLATFEFDAATQTVSKAVALTGIRKFLFDNVPELKGWADKSASEGGLNIEGIAVDPDPQHPRVLLGLRGPVLNGRALIVPIKQRDRMAPLTLENIEMDEPNAFQLNLNGQAIRDIQYDSRLRSFLIISGSLENEAKTDFTLWEWMGDGNQAREDARPKEQILLDKKMKPEGVTHLKISNRDFVFIVGDADSYAKVDYIEQ